MVSGKWPIIKFILFLGFQIDSNDDLKKVTNGNCINGQLIAVRNDHELGRIEIDSNDKCTFVPLFNIEKSRIYEGVKVFPN